MCVWVGPNGPRTRCATVCTVSPFGRLSNAAPVSSAHGGRSHPVVAHRRRPVPGGPPLVVGRVARGTRPTTLSEARPGAQRPRLRPRVC